MPNHRQGAELLQLPDSPLAQEILDLVKQVSAPYLFNHCVRSYLFAELLGQHDQLEYDSEVLFFGCLMHDLGITKKFMGKSRFEIDGADAAYQILVNKSVDKNVAAIVWDAIALHSTSEIPLRKCAEVALVYQATGLDVLGERLGDLPPQSVKNVLEEYPRHNFKQNIINEFIEYLVQNPKGGGNHWMGELAETHLHIPRPCFERSIRQAPFDE